MGLFQVFPVLSSYMPILLHMGWIFALQQQCPCSRSSGWVQLCEWLSCSPWSYICCGKCVRWEQVPPLLREQSGFQIRSSIWLPESLWCTWWNVTLVRSCYTSAIQSRTIQIQNSSAGERERMRGRRKLSNGWNDISMRSLPLGWQLKSKFYEDEEHGATWADLTCCKGLNFSGMNWFGNWVLQYIRPKWWEEWPSKGNIHRLFPCFVFWIHLCNK